MHGVHESPVNPSLHEHVPDEVSQTPLPLQLLGQGLYIFVSQEYPEYYEN